MTHDEFVKEIKQANPNIRILGEFVNVTTKIKVECLIDGRVWDAPPRKLLKGVGCKSCSTKKNGDTHVVSPEQYRDRIKMTNPNIKLLTDYVNANTKITVMCLLDGYAWDAFPATLYRGGCPKCANRKLSETKTLSHEEYIEDLRLSNTNIEVLGTYTGARNKIEVRCIKHNYVWMAFPPNLRKGQGCKKCKSEKMSARAMPHDDFVKALSEINPDIEVLGKYENCDNKILVHCKKHDIKWESTGSRLLNGSGCVKCGIEKLTASQKLSNSEVIERLSIANPNIELVGDYAGTNHKSNFKCLVCGNEWEAIIGNIWSGCGCPQCASSKGESAIELFLQSSDILYKHQHTFRDCKNEQPLRFDFYIPSENIAIEFQGQQHFKPVDFAGRGKDWAEERFVYGQLNDQIKRDYCTTNNIRLVEIRYDEIDNIPDIISSTFSAQKAVSA